MHLSHTIRVLLAHIRQLEEVDMVKSIIIAMLFVVLVFGIIALDQNKVEIRGTVGVTNGEVVFSLVTNVTAKACPMWIYQEGSNSFWGFIKVNHPDKIAMLKHQFPYQVRSFGIIGVYHTDVPFYVPGSRLYWNARERKMVQNNNGPCFVVVRVDKDKIHEYMRYD